MMNCKYLYQGYPEYKTNGSSLCYFLHPNIFVSVSSKLISVSSFPAYKITDVDALRTP